jgi:hypothetical protein
MRLESRCLKIQRREKMPRVYSTDAKLASPGELLQSAHGYIREKKLKSFSYAIFESTKNTYIVECPEFFKKDDIDGQEVIDNIRGKMCHKPEDEIIYGRIFGTDSEFRWEPKEPGFTVILFVNWEEEDNIEGFRYSELLSDPQIKSLFLWGDREGSVYRDLRIPQDLKYPVNAARAKIKVEQYEKDWNCVFSRFVEVG